MVSAVKATETSNNWDFDTIYFQIKNFIKNILKFPLTLFDISQIMYESVRLAQSYSSSKKKEDK